MSDSGTATRLAFGVTRKRLSWITHIALFSILCAVLSAANWAAVRAAVNVWTISPTYSHCYFIIPVSAWLIWMVRDQLRQLVPAASWFYLLFALPFIAIQIVASIASVTEIQQLALIGIVQVLALSVLGRAVYQQIAFPMLFLFFLVPMGEYLISPLQRFTTWFISIGLDLIGILHHTEGTFIQLVGGTFRVAEACAGLRFLIATIAIGALFSYLNYRKWHKIVIFMLASAIVPVVANGFRALGIVLLAHYSNNTVAVGTDHLVYGWGFSVLILGLLMFSGVRFADPVLETAPRAELTQGHSPADGIAATAIVAFIMVFAAPAFGYWNEHRPAYFNRAAISVPVSGAGWSITAFSNAWRPKYPNSDSALRYGLIETGGSSPGVDVQILYYAKTKYGHGLISSANSLWDEDEWHLVAQNEKRTSLGSQDVVFHEEVIASHQRTEMIWWTYWENGVFTNSPIKVKLDSLKTGLAGPTGSALIAISTSVESDPATAESRLAKAMFSLERLPDSLNAAAGNTARR
jgi:exosortase A